MVVTQDLIQRSGDLKRELVAFACSGRFDREMRQTLQQSGTPVAPDGSVDIDALDHFILRHKLADGRPVVEHFVDAHPELSEADRTLVLGWRDVVEGIFSVERLHGDGLEIVNLVDELTYVVYSNLGARVFTPIAAGSFVIGRLVPLGHEWLVSGVLRTLPAEQHLAAYQSAARLALRNPTLAYRNPVKLEQAWRLQRENREAFIAFFGEDLIVVPGNQLTERMRAFHHFQLYDLRDSEGTTAAERAIKAYGAAPKVPDVEMPEDLRTAETVGVLYDEVDGLSFLPDFGAVQEAFDRPERSALRRYRKLLLSILRDPSSSPRILRRLADRDPERASQVFQRVLKQPRFSWERDGEALLHQYKADYLEKAVLPTIAVVSAAVARAQMSAPAGEEISGADR